MFVCVKLYIKIRKLIVNFLFSYAILWEVSIDKAWQSASLQRMRHLCFKDGSPLSMGEQLRRLPQLQIFPAVSGVCTSVLYVYYSHFFTILYTILESEYNSLFLYNNIQYLFILNYVKMHNTCIKDYTSTFLWFVIHVNLFFVGWIRRNG